jgi:hypothetical protein
VLNGDIYGVHAILVADAHGSLECMGVVYLTLHSAAFFTFIPEAWQNKGFNWQRCQELHEYLQDPASRVH